MFLAKYHLYDRFSRIGIHVCIAINVGGLFCKRFRDWQSSDFGSSSLFLGFLLL